MGAANFGKLTDTLAQGAARAAIPGRDATCEPAPGSLWRGGANVLCFIGFAVLAIFGTLVLLPAALVLPGNRSRRVRRLASLGFRILLVFIQSFSLGKIHIEGKENLARASGCLLIANHPSFVDSLVLFALLPEANCIMKAVLRHHPLFAPFVHAGGYISNASGPLETIAACRRAKENGETIIIFPEGSRTPADTMPRLHRGAAQIALRAGMDILPVTIHCDPPILTHDRPWYYMPSRRVEYVVSFHEPRQPRAFAPTDDLSPPHAARRLTRALQTWFEHQFDSMHTADIAPPSAPQSTFEATASLQPNRSS
ncbi:MAG: 1-acyl-sn-glycerol-3-phosphate acyltransferase [Gammaproteobacteria bacterium]|nr:1-acyl-sn-glycerol-3-phosphate acyltransferase [Gammaproteobacteria bacterium]